MNDCEPAESKEVTLHAPLVEKVDYYVEDGLMVLTREFLLKRGYCCGSRCRHCPYDYINVPDHNK